MKNINSVVKYMCSIRKLQAPHQLLLLGKIKSKYSGFHLYSPTRRFISSSYLFHQQSYQKHRTKVARKILEEISIKKIPREMDDILAPLQASVKEQGDLVRKLKADKVPENDIKQAVTELKVRKKILEDKVLELNKGMISSHFNRAKLEDLLKQRFFYDMSFSLYGGVTGLYDFGPMGCAMKANMLAEWRNFFILEEQMLEVDCSMLTPEHVLRASGHVDRFADHMVKDLKTGECFRADHLIEAHFEKVLSDKKINQTLKDEITALLPKVESLSMDDMGVTINKYGIKSPTSGNDLSAPMEFNLMFSTSIGPTGQLKGFLRPETAQGIFVNFKRLLEFNQGKLPFATAQIGNTFRNEISPRSALLRVREFTMAEIEHFCDPDDKLHPKFSHVHDTELLLYSACNQLDGTLPIKKTVGQAVSEGLIANQILGYYMARIYQFLVYVGVDPSRLRFRQHMSNEMAHYATDCWDGECHTSYGWVECVGCADRSCYDLLHHSKCSGTKLVAEKPLKEPVTRIIVEVQPDRAVLGKVFKKEAGAVIEKLSKLEDIPAFESALKNEGSYDLLVNDKSYEILPNMAKIKSFPKTFHVQEICPSVIEPSFGIGRIMYTIFEHNFRMRDNDEQRTYIALPPSIAPYKCSLLPLSNNVEFDPFIERLSSDLKLHGMSHKIENSSGSIGRRYARTDQIAVPFGITVDFDTVKKSPTTVTFRERDSMKQIRAPIEDIALLVRDLSLGHKSWIDVLEQYPLFEQQDCSKQ